MQVGQPPEIQPAPPESKAAPRDNKQQELPPKNPRAREPDPKQDFFELLATKDAPVPLVAQSSRKPVEPVEACVSRDYADSADDPLWHDSKALPVAPAADPDSRAFDALGASDLSPFAFDPEALRRRCQDPAATWSERVRAYRDYQDYHDDLVDEAQRDSLRALVADLTARLAGEPPSTGPDASPVVSTSLERIVDPSLPGKLIRAPGGPDESSA